MCLYRVDESPLAWAWQASTLMGSSIAAAARRIASARVPGRSVPRPERIGRANRVADGTGRLMMWPCGEVEPGAQHRVPRPQSKQWPTTPRPVVSCITCLAGGPAYTGCHFIPREPGISLACASPKISLPEPTELSRVCSELLGVPAKERDQSWPASARRYVPDLPPVFSHRVRSPMTMERSADLHMS